MNFKILKNGETCSRKEIPELSKDKLREAILDEFKLGSRVAGFFGHKVLSQIFLYVVLADDKNNVLKVTSTSFGSNNKEYASFTSDLPSFHMFEREFFEEFGVKPIQNEWLKPVRLHRDNYPFYNIDSEEMHEVGVGPVHAGVIEPGHFRFLCHGEDVYHLEIALVTSIGALKSFSHRFH